MFFGYLDAINRFIILSAITILLAMYFFSCESNKETEIKYKYDKETMPTVTTHNDTMYVSDSGRIRFKVIAKTMLIFDQATEPYYLFPDKAYLEQYDTLMNVITTVVADSVWNFEKQKLWKLRGNVEIINSEGATFNSQELFMNQEKDKIYSNEYVVINEPYKTVMKAYGFESNQSMTEYTYRRATDVDVYVYENTEDQTKSDSLK